MIAYFLRFATVGVINTLIGYAVIFLCMYGLGQGPVLSNIVGYAVGLVISFVLNRSYTFRSKAAAGSQAVRFAMFFGVAYLVNLGVLLWLTRHLGMGNGVSQVAAGAAYFVVFFILSKYFVFAADGRNS